MHILLNAHMRECKHLEFDSVQKLNQAVSCFWKEPKQYICARIEVSVSIFVLNQIHLLNVSSAVIDKRIITGPAFLDIKRQPESIK